MNLKHTYDNIENIVYLSDKQQKVYNIKRIKYQPSVKF